MRKPDARFKAKVEDMGSTANCYLGGASTHWCDAELMLHCLDCRYEAAEIRKYRKLGLGRVTRAPQQCYLDAATREKNRFIGPTTWSK